MSDKKLTVRHAVSTDREATIGVLLDAYQQYEQTLSAERWAQYKDSILQAIDSATTKARLVAELDGEIVGSVFLYDSSETAYGAPQLEIHNPIIRLLGVSRGARGFGVATELIRSSAKLALEWEADTLHLHTSDMMDSAVRLYERLGFERAYDKEFMNGDLLVKSYRLPLKESVLLQA
ncbi:GNAT family N-acetyltransferase [Cohnella lupini]|uniref:GNAT family N-acetyltransferase n=1 Tax=Cohnella lupini TaxID=1294267 RepID=UPI000E269926|nr:GNAT family N-acetyltransferase [Cohnella lupini]